MPHKGVAADFRLRKVMHETDHNMKRRRNDHDYSGRCIYMVTIETEGRRALLGRVVGECAETAHVELSPLGQEVERAWLRGGEIYKDKGLRLITHQVMPDHFHGLLFLTKEGEVTLGQVVNGFKVGSNRAYTQLMNNQSLGSETKEGNSAARQRSTEQITGPLNPAPVVCAPAMRVQGASASPSGPHSAHGLLWTHGYHDRILTHAGQLEVLKNYIHDNPRRAWVKRMNHSYFAQHKVRVGKTTFNAIGNDSLLRATNKVQVQVSRQYHRPDAPESARREWDSIREHFLQSARNGAVLVSPCISKGEQKIARIAKTEGLTLIVLLENGFSEHYKPVGAYFDACAAGRLLMLAPWEHHTEHRAISRNQCLQLNTMAKDIVDNLYVI